MKNISIPNPCSEDWNEMSPEDQGRFCSVCSKCVIDFTEKNTQEIQKIIEINSGENICGRFYNHQLNIEVSKLEKWFFKYIPASFQNNRITLSLFSLILSLTGCSKEKESCVSTTGVLIVEEDTLQKNDNFVLGEPLIENDSIAKMHQKDSLKIINKK